MADQDKRPQLPDVPALTAICTLITAIALIALIVALMADAPAEITGALAVVLIALGLYIRRIMK